MKRQDDIHTCWVFLKDGTPVKSRADGRPNMRGVSAKCRAAYAAIPPERRKELARIGNRAMRESDKYKQWEASEAGREQMRTNAAKARQKRLDNAKKEPLLFNAEQARRGAGAGRASALRGQGRGGYSKRGTLGDLRCDSLAERNFAAFIMALGYPIRRWDRQGLLYDEGRHRWYPDFIVTLPSGEERFVEVKHDVRAPTDVKPAGLRQKNVNRIIAKCKAHPDVMLVNGYSVEMRSRHARLEATGAIPAWKVGR